MEDARHFENQLSADIKDS